MVPNFPMLLVCGVVIASTICQAGGDSGEFQTVTTKEWAETVNRNGKLLVVFYKESGCPSCQEMVDAVTSLVGDPDVDGGVQIGQSSDTSLAIDLGVTSFPMVVFLRDNSYAFYDGKPEIEGLFQWLELSGSKVTQHLHDDSFEHLTQASTGATTGDWLVAFYQESCKRVLPVMESLAIRIRQKTNVAVVDTSKNTLLADRFSIKKCPEIMLFKQGKMFRYEIPKIDQPSLKSFVDAWHKNSKAETVLPPKSKFDFLTESIADSIKKQLQGEHRPYIIAAFCGFCLVLLAIVVCCCKAVAGSNKKQKYE